MKITTEQQEQALGTLRDLLHPGDVVYTIVTHVARSGETRWIRVFVIRDNHPIDISWNVGRALGRRRVNNPRHEGVEVGGCGMDMGFELVYSLSRKLFPGGFECIGLERECPGNGHLNLDDSSHHNDSGYALIQRWL